MPNSSQRIGILLLWPAFAASGISALAQAPLPVPQQPPVIQGAPLPVPSQAPAAYPPAELERIVSPIALYPDPLLAQVLAAATFSSQIPDAAQWADQHHYLTGPALTAAIAADRVSWDPSVQALIPFPSILANPYAGPRYSNARPQEQHRVIERSEREREDSRSGRRLREEHHRSS